MENTNEFEEANNKLDKVQETERIIAKKGVKEGFNSNIKLRDKTFMNISDVDREDADWFKAFSDKHTDRKQFLALKVIRQVMERLDPLVTNIIKQLNRIDDRIDVLEAQINTPVEDEDTTKVIIPQTQGAKRSSK